MALPFVALVAIGATVAVAIWLTAASLRWPLVHDGPVMHYIAWRIRDGAVPYRDLFDMNFPGVYVVHLVALVLLGPGDAGFRVFDLALLVLVAGGLAVTLRPFGLAAALTGPALFWLYHVAGGAWRAGQRDLLLCVPLAWMVVAAGQMLRWGHLRDLVCAGFALGVAVWIKPHAVLWLPLLAGLAWWRLRRGAACAILGLSLLAPALPVSLWLYRAGAWPAFLDITTGYLLPLYGHVGRVSPLDAIAGQYLGVPVLAGLATWAGLAALALRRPPALLVAGVGYGVLHYAIQGKGWEYHLYPLALFLVALGAAGLGRALREHRALVGTALVATLGATTWILGAKGAGGLDPAWIAEKMGRVATLTATLAPDVATGGTVQVLDTAEGGIHALLRLGAREPTRFLYDFPFYHDVEHPYVARLRGELLDGLAAYPPAAVVLFESGWPAGGYARLDRFPALRDWLAGHYRLDVEADGYRVYRRRPA